MLHAAAQCCIPATTTARGTKAGTFYQAKKRQQRLPAGNKQATGDGFCRCHCRWLWAGTSSAAIAYQNASLFKRTQHCSATASPLKHMQYQF